MSWNKTAYAAFAFSAVLAGSASAQTPGQDFCAALTVAEDGALSLTTTPGYTVWTAIPPLASPPGVAGYSGILCDRAAISIGPVDHRVLSDLHVPLYIRNSGRVAVLESINGELRIRFHSGAPTADEREALAAALDRATDALLALQRQAAPAQ